YFGDEEARPCGVWHLCLERRRTEKRRAEQHEETAARLLERLAEGPADVRRLADAMACPPERVAETVRLLLEEGKIAADKEGILRINP
ncbi:MAG: RecQ family ATP-dependent DNA helicase, partial [Alistipes sp.]|nr:RecQ family ATP-dependent DNA helicase [Alistipes sp.]